MTSKNTIVCDFPRRKMKLKDEDIELIFWDPSGQDRYIPQMMPTYYKRANAAIFLFDITKKSSFDRIEYFYQNVQKNLNVYDIPGQINQILVGNKIDSEDQREVNKIEAEV